MKLVSEELIVVKWYLLWCIITDDAIARFKLEYDIPVVAMQNICHQEYLFNVYFIV